MSKAALSAKAGFEIYMSKSRKGCFVADGRAPAVERKCLKGIHREKVAVKTGIHRLAVVEESASVVRRPCAVKAPVENQSRSCRDLAKASPVIHIARLSFK